MVRVANRCVDKVRRRVQNETLGHRGRKHDPLYRIRKLLLTGAERLDERGHDRLLLGLRVGDPHDEVLGAWLAKEIGARRVSHRRSRRRRAAARQGDHRLPRTTTSPRSSRWVARSPRGATEILAHHTTGASNGPTEGLNLCVKKVKRCGHGFRTFEHYRLRVLLHAGGVTWPDRPSPPRIRTGRSLLRRVEPIELGLARTQGAASSPRLTDASPHDQFGVAPTAQTPGAAKGHGSRP